MEMLGKLERRRGTRTPRTSAWEAVQAPVRIRPLVSAGPYFIGSGDGSCVPQTSAIVPIRPSLWLQFGYSARRFFCSSRQKRVELGRRLAPHAGQDMAVRVQGKRDLRMSKAFLDDLRMDALGQQ